MDFSKTYRVVSPKGTRDAKLSDLLAESPKTLLYFYPKDNTPGCTMEAQDFTRAKEAFLDAGIAIIGVSLDGEKSHEKFRDDCSLGIDLIVDDGTLHEEFEVIGEKMNYGKTYVGVIRSTFLIDASGVTHKEWRNVKATGHAAKVARELGIET